MPTAEMPLTLLSRSGEAVKTCELGHHTDDWAHAVWSSDSQLIASVGEHILIHRATCDEQTPLKLPTRATPLGFIPGTHDLVTLHAGGEVRIWPLDDEVALTEHLWNGTDYCLPSDRRQALLSETKEEAEAGLKRCEEEVAKRVPKQNANASP